MGGRQSSTAGTSRLSASNSPAHMYPSASSDGDDGRVPGLRIGMTVPADVRPRTRSLSNVLQSSNGQSSSNGHPHPHHHHPHQAHNHHPHLHQPSLMSMAGLSFGLSSGSPDSDTSAEDMPHPFGRVFSAHSLPAQSFIPFNGIKCPVCSKTIPNDDVECHLVMCLTKPRIGYNEDVLLEQKGECVICLDDMNEGDTIARLPCLCIYHKRCIDNWFHVNRSCPEHPAD